MRCMLLLSMDSRARWGEVREDPFTYSYLAIPNIAPWWPPFCPMSPSPVLPDSDLAVVIPSPKSSRYEEWDLCTPTTGALLRRLELQAPISGQGVRAVDTAVVMQATEMHFRLAERLYIYPHRSSCNMTGSGRFDRT